MAQPTVQYTTHPHPSLKIILVDPFLDVTVHESVREAVEAAWREGLVSLDIDCSAVEFMDSSGVGLLVALHKRLGGGHRRVKLKNVKPAIRGVFSLLCLEDLFEFE